MGKGPISDRKEQSLLSIGLGFKDYVMGAVEQADLILTVGYDIAEYSPKKWNPNRDKKIIHIDFSPAEVYVSYDPDVEIVADISGTLWELIQKLADENILFEKDWFTLYRKQIIEDIKSYDLKEGEYFTIPGALNIIHEILDDSGLLISDVGSHKMWIARNYPTCVPNGCIVINGLASMGISLPGAIAASLIDPDRQVVAAMGDGGFLMNSQELATAKQLGVNCTFVIFNDDEFGLIKWKQQMSRGKSVFTKLNNPDFKAYAESFGIKAYQPKNVSDLTQQMRQAINSKELNVIEVPVDPSVNNELIKKLKKYWEENS